MSLRLSIGSRWIEICILMTLMMGAKIYLQIECGNKSTRNLISWRKHNTGFRFFKLGQ